jgi:hypothetical protein
MKITISELKQLIKEELTDEDVKFLINGLKPLFDTAEKNQKEIDKTKGEVHKLYKRSNELNGAVQSLEKNVLTINDKLSIEKEEPSRFGEPEAEQEWDAESTTDTNPGGKPTNEEIRRMVKEELDELREK